MPSVHECSADKPAGPRLASQRFNQRALREPPSAGPEAFLSNAGCRVKEWAFINGTGYDRITAAEALRRRNADGGLNRNVIFYSRHASGTRLRMALIAGEKTPHFAYRLGGAKRAEHMGPPESIHHSLFKQALAGLDSIRLMVNGQYHSLQIEEREIEPELTADGHLIRPDVAWRFTSDTLLDKMWGCKVYVEVCHSHPVPQFKLERLRAASLPVIEVRIPENLLFRGDETASDNWQRNYINYIKNYFEDPKHWLKPILLHDPRSSGYINIMAQWSADKEAARLAQQKVVGLQAQVDRSVTFRRSVAELPGLVPSLPRSSGSAAPVLTLLPPRWFKRPRVWAIAAVALVMLMGALWLTRGGRPAEETSSDATSATAPDAQLRLLVAEAPHARPPVPPVHAKKKPKKRPIAALAPPADTATEPSGWYAIPPQQRASEAGAPAPASEAVSSPPAEQ